MNKVVIYLIFVCCMSSATAFANYFESCRCPRGLATVGDSKLEVEKECGKPVRIESGYIKVKGRKIYGERWIYNFGPTEFMQAIAFDSSQKVVGVESLQIGFKEK